MAESYNPDVLTCLANLSNDEVFTPPAVVNAMLDLLPQELFASPKTRFLDPAAKSGVFLREIAKRLIKGLEREIPDLQKRVDHILHNQVFGIATTELTSLVSRRTLYCSKYPNCRYSVSPFDTVEGNIRFRALRHTFVKGRCKWCGASESQFDRDESLESHAYEFIHTSKPEEIFNMKFDVIIGNPPYQMATGGGQIQSRPMYQNFVRQAINLKPRYLIMITPSRWFAGGMGLDDYRDEMLSGQHIKEIVDYSLSTECFPGVDIAGGVSYFLWESTYKGSCRYTYIDGDYVGTRNRVLNQYSVFVRDNRAIDIVDKVVRYDGSSVSDLMSPLSPFGIGSSVRGLDAPDDNCYSLLSSAGKSYIHKKDVTTGYEYIDKWKVIIGKATSAGAATAGRDGMRKVVATLDILPPNTVCTFSYFIAGAFSSQLMATNYKTYLASKFVRFLLLQSLSSINISKDKFRFVPLQDFSKPWTDEELYKKYGLTKDEIAFIESMIKPME